MKISRDQHAALLIPRFDHSFRGAKLTTEEHSMPSRFRQLMERLQREKSGSAHVQEEEDGQEITGASFSLSAHYAIPTTADEAVQAGQSAGNRAGQSSDSIAVNDHGVGTSGSLLRPLEGTRFIFTLNKVAESLAASADGEVASGNVESEVVDDVTLEATFRGGHGARGGNDGTTLEENHGRPSGQTTTHGAPLQHNSSQPDVAAGVNQASPDGEITVIDDRTPSAVDPGGVDDAGFKALHVASGDNETPHSEMQGSPQKTELNSRAVEFQHEMMWVQRTADRSHGVHDTSAAKELLSDPVTFLENVDASEWPERLAERMRLTQTGTMTQLKMTLHPEHLGKVDVQLVWEQGKLQAHFRVQGVEAQQVIESQINRLAEALEGRGIALDSYSVDQGTAHLGSQGRETQQSDRETTSRATMLEEDVQAGEDQQNDELSVSLRGDGRLEMWM